MGNHNWIISNNMTELCLFIQRLIREYNRQKDVKCAYKIVQVLDCLHSWLLKTQQVQTMQAEHWKRSHQDSTAMHLSEGYRLLQGRNRMFKIHLQFIIKSSQSLSVAMAYKWRFEDIVVCLKQCQTYLNILIGLTCFSDVNFQIY